MHKQASLTPWPPLINDLLLKGRSYSRDLLDCRVSSHAVPLVPVNSRAATATILLRAIVPTHGVGVGVGVGVNVGAGVGSLVDVGVPVLVGIGVTVSVGLAVAVFVGSGVGVGVNVSVGVGV